MAKKQKYTVIDKQKDGDILIETVIQAVDKKQIPVCDARGMILYWIEE